MERNLRGVHFNGTLGEIAFNEEREVVTEVDIFHVRDGEEIYAGNYSPITGNITVHLPPERIPSDEFDRVIRLPLAFPVVVFVITGALLVFTTIVLVLFVYYWNKPLIKATSPSLSLVILAGCCVMYMAECGYNRTFT